MSVRAVCSNTGLGGQRLRSFICISTAIIACVLCSPSSNAQATRSLTVWIDTTTINVCAAKSFQVPVFVGDIYYHDSVSAVSLTVYWDPATLDFDNIVL